MTRFISFLSSTAYLFLSPGSIILFSCKWRMKEMPTNVVSSPVLTKMYYLGSMWNGNEKRPQCNWHVSHIQLERALNTCMPKIQCWIVWISFDDWTERISSISIKQTCWFIVIDLNTTMAKQARIQSKRLQKPQIYEWNLRLFAVISSTISPPIIAHNHRQIRPGKSLRPTFEAFFFLIITKFYLSSWKLKPR